MPANPAPRTIDRGANPFAPMIQQRNQSFSSQKNIYQSIEQRVANMPDFEKSLKILAAKLEGKTFEQKHFGRLEMQPIKLLDINIDINRDPVYSHACTIIENFDPRIMQAVNVTFIKARGRYSVWEGQHTSIVLYVLLQAGLITGDFLVQCKVIDDDLVVPGSPFKGEGFANRAFNIINGGARLEIDAYNMHRSRVNGVRLYGSTDLVDLQSEEIQTILEKNHMFPAPAHEAKGQKATPGMVTHISGVNKIAHHGTIDEFNSHKQDLNRALAWHDRYFSSAKGVDGGFIMAFGRLYEAARKQNIDITVNTEQDLFELFRAKWGSPRGFHKDCKTRLNKFQTKNNLATSWSDNCLAVVLVSDYLTWKKSKGYHMPHIAHMMTYAGI